MHGGDVLVIASSRKGELWSILGMLLLLLEFSGSDPFLHFWSILIDLSCSLKPILCSADCLVPYGPGSGKASVLFSTISCFCLIIFFLGSRGFPELRRTLRSGNLSLVLDLGEYFLHSFWVSVSWAFVCLFSGFLSMLYLVLSQSGSYIPQENEHFLVISELYYCSL